MVLKSYAKLNLYLAVLNKRKDNYHNIETVFERIDLCDRITLTSLPDKKIDILCDNPAVPKDATNLCYKSAALLQERFKLKEGVRIKINKRIPVGAGLGGGSSNAAAVLVGLNKLWRLGLSKEKLAGLARKIGADAAFFVYGAAFAAGYGRGDRIRLLKALTGTRLWHILAVPRFSVSTARIYKQWDALNYLNNIKGVGLTKAGRGVKILTSALQKNRLIQAPETLYNGLEQATVNLYPEVKRIKEQFSGLGVSPVRMSGSGPAVFGVVATKREAVSKAGRLRKMGQPWQVFVTTTC